MYRKTLAILTLTALALTGCTASPTAPAPTVTVTAEPAPVAEGEAWTSAEEEYVGLWRMSGMEGFAETSDADMQVFVDNGHKTCDTLDKGASPATIVQAAVEGGVPIELSSLILAFSVGALCNEHTADLNAYLAP